MYQPVTVWWAIVWILLNMFMIIFHMSYKISLSNYTRVDILFCQVMLKIITNLKELNACVCLICHHIELKFRHVWFSLGWLASWCLKEPLIIALAYLKFKWGLLIVWLYLVRYRLFSSVSRSYDKSSTVARSYTNMCLLSK